MADHGRGEVLRELRVRAAVIQMVVRREHLHDPHAELLDARDHGRGFGASITAASFVESSITRYV